MIASSVQVLKHPKRDFVSEFLSSSHIFWEAYKFCEIFTLLLTICTVVKSKVKISQNFVAFSEYMNFTFIISNRLWFLFLALFWLLASLGEWLGAWLPHMPQKKHPTRSMTQTCKENVLCVDEVERRWNYYLVIFSYTY